MDVILIILYWVAGKINGATLATISTVGRYGFSVHRSASYATGV